MDPVDFIWPGEVVSMIEKEKKFHVKINCSGKLIEVIYSPEKEEYHLGEKVMVRGRLTVEEIIKCSSFRDPRSYY